MMTAKQIFLLFGFFLSMFYIFKYGNVTTAQQVQLCHELEALQLETLSEITPLIRADVRDTSFEAKLNRAQSTLKASPEFSDRQKRVQQINGRLSGYTCPAPSFVQLARVAAKVRPEQNSP